MRALTWTIRLAAFLILLAFAAKNADPVTLRFYFDLAWQLPLIGLLLAFFAGGALFGVAAALGTVLRQRRELARLKRATPQPPGDAGQGEIPPASGP